MAEPSEKQKQSIGELVMDGIKLVFAVALVVGGGFAYIANSERHEAAATASPQPQTAAQTESPANNRVPETLVVASGATEDGAFGTSGHIISSGTMACVLRQAAVQLVAIANEIGKHPERHATNAALDLAEKIGCHFVAGGTAIEIVDRVGPYVQYHEPGNAELLWAVSNFVDP